MTKPISPLPPTLKDTGAVALGNSGLAPAARIAAATRARPQTAR